MNPPCTFTPSALRRAVPAVAWLVAIAGWAAPAGAQLTLDDALRRADRFAYGNRIAAGTARAQAGQAIAPLTGIVPAVRLEAGYVRTTDPIGAFGTTLRQRAIAPTDFDPARLNYPGAVANHQAAVVLEQPLLNADAWIGWRGARHAAAAASDAAEWTRIGTRVDVVRAYYGAVLAGERVRTLRSAARAAVGHVTQAEAMVRQGLVTRSDALLASVRAGEIEAQLAEAEGERANARRQLAVLLGGQADALDGDSLPPALPAGDRIRAILAPDTATHAAVALRARADLRAAARGYQAARADVLRARSAYLPRLNSFARYDWNSAARPYAGDRSWTVGMLASWTLFAGAGEAADVQSTRGRAAAARAQREATEAGALLQAEQTRTALIVALRRLDITERAVAQSAEAHRLVSRRYAGELATVVEVLDAQALANQSALSLAHARWAAIVAGAERRRALGADPATLDAFDDPGPTVAGVAARGTAMSAAPR